MGCNCKVNKQILKIHKNYGHNINTSWVAKGKFRIKKSIFNVIYIMILLLLSPFAIVWFLYFLIRGKNIININKILKKFIRKSK
jgi:hypothetical protein